MEKLYKGIRFTFKRSQSPVAYCALTIRSGTRNECGTASGTAHFTEHLLFKGTERKSAGTINSHLEKAGGELNAFTTKEETVIHATVLKEDLLKGVSLLFELAYHSLFRERDIEKEKGVVIDEIQSYKDSPPEAIYDHFEELLLEGTPLSPQILGTAKSVRTISREDIIRYTSANFMPSNMSLSIVANLPHEKALSIAEKAARKYIPSDAREADTTERTSFSDRLAEGRKFNISLNKRNHQANCIIGCTGYPIGAERERIALVLLCNILGGPAANSRLNMHLREKKGWVYGVDTSYTPYSDNGVVAISFGCDKENLEKCMTAIHSELAVLRDKPLSDNELKAAKRQLKGQMAISADNGENKCLSMGKNCLIFNDDSSEEKGLDILESITSEDLTACARTIFSEERLSTLIYL